GGLGAALAFQVWWVALYHKFLELQNAGQLELIAEVEARQPHHQVVCCFSASSPTYALWFGNGCTAEWDGSEYGKFSEPLQARYPKLIFYDTGTRTFANFVRTVELREVTRGRRPVLLWGTPFEKGYEEHRPPDVDLTLVAPEDAGDAEEVLYLL